MKRSTYARGYTILEVMIFLVITGVLLVSAVLVFSGRQQRTQFTQGVREIDAQIRTIINETASGYYPNKGDVFCTSTPGGGPQLDEVDQSQAGANQQGANEGCLFLGRVLEFNTGSTYSAYTVVGQQIGQNNKEVTTLGQSPDTNSALQTLLVKASGQNDAPDATVTFSLPWGIKVTRVATSSSVVPQTIAFGFITSFGAYTAGGTDLVSGKSGINAIPLSGPSTLASAAQPEIMVTETKGMAADPVNPGKIVICLRSGGGDRQAAIIIGGSNSNTGTEIAIDSVPTECSDA